MNNKILNNQSLLSLNNGYRLQWEVRQNAYVLLYPEGMVKLNSTAADILKRFADKEVKFNELIKDLKHSYGDVDLEGDVCEFLYEAKSNDWITIG